MMLPENKKTTDNRLRKQSPMKIEIITNFYSFALMKDILFTCTHTVY